MESTVASPLMGMEGATAGLFKRPEPSYRWQLNRCPFLTRPGRLGTQPLVQCTPSKPIAPLFTKFDEPRAGFPAEAVNHETPSAH